MKCAWCGDEFEDAEEWSVHESLLSGDPAVARLRLWLYPTPERFKPDNEPIELELHPGECYRTARDELRRALFSTRSEFRPDGRRAVLPHGWWHMLEKEQVPKAKAAAS